MRLLLLLCAGAALCSAEQACPWMNEATASGILGGSAKATAKKGDCEFAAAEGKLRIDVAVTPEATQHFASLKVKCGADAKELPAIGNEAVACLAHGSERVIGRVRDQVFIITLRMKGAEPEALFDKSRFAAEQVSGILF